MLIEIEILIFLFTSAKELERAKERISRNPGAVDFRLNYKIRVWLTP